MLNLMFIWKMSFKDLFILLFVCSLIHELSALTDSNDLSALTALKSSLNNLPPNWVGTDPCGSNWEGVNCTSNRVTSLTLAGTGLEGSDISDISSLTGLQLLDLSNNIGLKGTIPSSIGNLKNLSILILLGCSFSGSIPDSIGSLSQLVYLSLNSNSFSGSIPPSLGNLAQLSWLDLSINGLTGNIPVSSQSQTTPGLDMLLRAKHFHLSNNQLSGPIPDQLFSPNMHLIHAIFDNNKFTGNVPSSLGDVQTLEVIRFDRNSLEGPLPSSLSNLTSLNEIYLSNNKFNGSIPDLTQLNSLTYVDMSNNSFNASNVPAWFSSLQSLTTLMMDNTNLQGQVPSNIFKLPQLETLVLSNNDLTGNLSIGNSYSSNLTVDLRNNSITDFQQKSSYTLDISLAGNPICNSNGASNAKYCAVPNPNNNFLPSNNCGKISCKSNEVLSPSCQCSHPYTGSLHFYSFSFTDLQNSTYYTTLYGSLMSAFLSNGVPVNSLTVSNPVINFYSYLQLQLQIFPSGTDSFNRTSISRIGFLLNRQPFTIPYFGPFFFIEDQYCCFQGSTKSSASVGLIVGIVVGGLVLVVFVILAGLYALRQKKKAKRAVEMSNPFASWDPEKGSGSVPQLQGAKWFSFEDLKKCTDDFSESNCIGHGGYGKVYKGTFASGQVVAIKRAQQGSMQGAHEFKTEIELLSRIHHRNVVNLVGFCYEQGEQMLVYEYISHGTLRDCLSGKSGFWLDWHKRLRIALDAARGLSYLHELADPPIIHRDVKSTNILLDNNLNAKVADFGLSKLVGDTGKGYITTQVKGTLGYMDPEYYMTQQLTDKSDVYSFGVVLLELLISRAPIERGKHIVRLVQEAISGSKEHKSLDEIIDPRLGSGEKLAGVNKYIEVSMRCVKESANDRPTMGEVVREIENIIEISARENKTNKDFSSTSSEEMTDTSPLHSYTTGEGFDASYGSFPFNVKQRSK